MTRPSSIDTLPAEVRDALHAWLRDPAITQLEAVDRTNALLDEIGIEKRVTKSSVNRYHMRMEEVGAKLRQSRQVAEMWIAKLGAQPQGQVGHLVNEILRTLAFDLTLTLQQGEIDPESAPEIAKVLKNMAIAMERLEKAASENVKREEEIRKQARAEAAKAAEVEAKRQGASAATIDALRAAIMQALAG